jgi:hypothetical protein
MIACSFDYNRRLHIMSGHVAQIREGSSTCRELKLNQTIGRDDHAFESLWTELWSPIATHIEIGTGEKFLGYYGMELCIVVAEPQDCLLIMMYKDVIRNEQPSADIHGDRCHFSWKCTNGGCEDQNQA